MLDDRDFTEAPTLLSSESRREAPGAGGMPEEIGGYKIVRRLGAGGMGVVFEAEQLNPNRRVAVKVVRGGLFVDEALVRSFKREASTLARLKHPGIATIYESGRTEDGQHFFAMELVRGKTLEAWVRDRPAVLDAREVRFRLALFTKIVEAVHYAHQRGVIHRDLKPSNILVGEECGEESLSLTLVGDAGPIALPPLKILDFGLARITDADAVAASTMTAAGVIQGTLSYMSPEQAKGLTDDLDLRTDVYSLGIVLFEMLTGKRPYDVSRGSVIESLRIVCEETPMSLRQGAGGRFDFDFDLETIVGRALEKSADRRYESAAALGGDIKRYLTAQPILARPPTALYQLRKFSQRNKALVGGLTATALVLVVGIVVSSLLAMREATQRRAADQARAELQSVVDYQARMLRELDAGQMGRGLLADLRAGVARVERLRGGSNEAVEAALVAFDRLTTGINPTDLALDLVDVHILQRAARDAGELFGEQPLVEAELRHILGEIYDELSMNRAAEAQTTQAVALRQRELGPLHPDTLDSMSRLALESMSQFNADPSEHEARRQRAAELFDTVLARRRQVLGDLHPDTLESIDHSARFSWYEGDFARAETLYEEALAGYRDVLGEKHPTTQQLMFQMACMFAWSERPQQAEELFLRTLAEQRALGEDPFGINATMRELGRLYFDLGRWQEAEALLIEVLEGWGALLGSGHNFTLRTGIGLAEIYLDQNRFAEAEQHLMKALDLVRGTPDILRLYEVDLLQSLGDLYLVTGRRERAGLAHAEALGLAADLLGPEHLRTLTLGTSVAAAPAPPWAADLPARFAAQVAAQLEILERARDAASVREAAEAFEAASARFRGKPGEAGLARHAQRLRDRVAEIEGQAANP